MANVEEGITFDLEKNAQVNQITSSYDPKLRLRKKNFISKKVWQQNAYNLAFLFFLPVINKVRFLLFLLINLS